MLLGVKLKHNMRHLLNERILKLNLILGEQIHISDFTMVLLKVQIKFKKKQKKT
jgi:hypothetical protein